MTPEVLQALSTVLTATCALFIAILHAKAQR